MSRRRPGAAPGRRTGEPVLTSDVEPPLRVSDPDAVAWTDEADIVVVGLGGAGVVAALEARDAGGAVLAVDRFDGGGATARSGGVLYAGGTRHQAAAGFQDTPDRMFRYLKAEGSAVTDETLRRFCGTSAADLDWLASKGVRFDGRFYGEKTPYPPDGYHLYYTGLERQREGASAAPRGHRAIGRGLSGGAYFEALRATAAAQGVQVLTHAPVRRLVIDPAGRVIGVEARALPSALRRRHAALYRQVDPNDFLTHQRQEAAVAACRRLERGASGERRLLRARRGVILAAGGFTFNQALLARHVPLMAAHTRTVFRGGTMGCDGSGVELGLSVGGATDRMDRILLTKAVSPPAAFVRGVLVNAAARRFVAEDDYFGTIGAAISGQPATGAAWLLVDEPTFREGVRQLLWPRVSLFGLPAIFNLLFGGTRRASGPRALAQRLGLDLESLAQTLSTFADQAAAGRDALGKQAEYLRPLRDGPLYAIDMSLTNRWSFFGAMVLGGLVVDEASGAVLRSDGSPIDGLFAAGRSAVGLCSEQYFSGLSLADTVFSGRRAARAAMGVAS